MELMIGDRVIYRCSWGAGSAREGTIIGASVMDYGYAEGQPVYDVRLEGGDTRWGYADQFTLLAADTDTFVPPTDTWLGG